MNYPHIKCQRCGKDTVFYSTVSNPLWKGYYCDDCHMSTLRTYGDNLKKTRKDKGMTRCAVLARLNRPRGIPEIEDYLRQARIIKDVSVNTAVNRMVADGVIERVKKGYHAYEAVLYRIKEQS